MTPMDMRAPMALLPLRLDRLVFAAGGRRIIDDVSLTIDVPAQLFDALGAVVPKQPGTQKPQ